MVEAWFFQCLSMIQSSTMNLPIKTLIKTGILGKDTIDRFISLERWNTMIVPAKSPTQRDFEKPNSFLFHTSVNGHLGADAQGLLRLSSRAGSIHV